MTDRAKEVAKKWNHSISSDSGSFGFVQRNTIIKAFISTDKVAVRSKSIISYGRIKLDLLGFEQIVSDSQTQSFSIILLMIPKLSKFYQR